MVITASGGHLTRAQAARVWDKTVFPLGRRLGLLTGYVKPQDGTSKRTAAGAAELQRDWYVVCSNLIEKVKQAALKILKDERLVHLMLPFLICNLDEECLHALGKNGRIAGSKDKTKHDTQNASSRHVFFDCGLALPTHFFFINEILWLVAK